MYEWLPADVELMTDTSETDWVIARLRPWDEDGVRVESFVPGVFESYARLDHLGGDPMDGSARATLGALMSVVSRSTPPNDPCWFCLWDGWGTWWKGAHSVLRSRSGPRISRRERKELRATVRSEERIDAERDAVLRRTPRVCAENRDYFLVRGPLSSVAGLAEAAGGQSPNLWWPEDRSWFVSTEIDGDSTIIGGSLVLIEALRTSSRLHAVETSIEDLLHPLADPPPRAPDLRR